MENPCLYLMMSLFSTLNQQSNNIGSPTSSHLDLVLTSDCVFVLGINQALGSFQLCDPETVKTQEWLLPGYSQRSSSTWVVFPTAGLWLLPPNKGVQETLKLGHLGELKLIGI